MADYDITSPTNEQVKRIVGLRRRRSRDQQRLFAVEERRIFHRALESGHRPVEVYICPDLTDPIEGQPHRTMSPEAMDRASYRKSSTGLIALFPYFERNLDQVLLTGTSLLLVAEGIEKPGNLGALLRIADGAGVECLILVDSPTDVFNPNAVRASTGALFTVPITRCGLAEAVMWLKNASARSVAADPDGRVSFWNSNLTGNCAIWVGSEADGLTGDALSHADEVVSIPMRGGADSLNTAVAAALLLYESMRQRAQSNRS